MISGFLPTDAASQLDVLGHDGNTLGVDGAQIGVLKDPDQIGLSCVLQGEHGPGLEAQVSLEVLSDLAHKALKGQLADQEIRALHTRTHPVRELLTTFAANGVLLGRKALLLGVSNAKTGKPLAM